MCKENHIFPQHAPICENFRLCALLSETFYNKVRKASLSLAQQFELAQLYMCLPLRLCQERQRLLNMEKLIRRIELIFREINC